MPRFRATVRVEGLSGESADDVRGALQAKLERAKLEGARVVGVERSDPRPERRRQIAPRVAPAEGAWRKESNAGGILLLVAVGWAVWFFWSVIAKILL